MTTWDLSFAQPNQPLSINKARHWSANRRRTQPWRELAWATARNRVVQARGFVPVPVTVQVTLSFREKRRRDPHNYTGTVVKAVVDGLVMAKVVPDDTAEWVTVLDPILAVQRTQTLTTTVAIRPRPTQETTP